MTTLDNLRIHYDCTDPDCHGRRQATVSDVVETLQQLGAETIEWCKSHHAQFNGHEGACIEWMANPSLNDCDVELCLVFRLVGESE